MKTKPPESPEFEPYIPATTHLAELRPVPLIVGMFAGTGALFIGFLLAVLSIKLKFPDAPRIPALGVPIVLLGVPLFDMALVTVNRLVHRRNPMAGGRDLSGNYWTEEAAYSKHESRQSR